MGLMLVLLERVYLFNHVIVSCDRVITKYIIFELNYLRLFMHKT